MRRLILFSCGLAAVLTGILWYKTITIRPPAEVTLFRLPFAPLEVSCAYWSLKLTLLRPMPERILHPDGSVEGIKRVPSAVHRRIVYPNGRVEEIQESRSGWHTRVIYPDGRHRDIYGDCMPEDVSEPLIDELSKWPVAFWRRATRLKVFSYPDRTVVCVPSWIPPAAFALYPCLVGLPLLYRRVHRRRGFCLGCGYNLTGNLSGICPECGTPTPSPPPPEDLSRVAQARGQ